MMFIDWCLIDTLFVSECWAQLHVRFHLTKLGKNFHWKDDEESPDLGDWAFNPWSWNPLPEEIRWAVKKKEKRKTHWGEGWASPASPGQTDKRGNAECCSANTSCTCRGWNLIAQTAATRAHTRESGSSLWSFSSPSTQRRAQALACQDLPPLQLNKVLQLCFPLSALFKRTCSPGTLLKWSLYEHSLPLLNWTCVTNIFLLQEQGIVIMGNMIIWGFINLIFGLQVELVVSDFFFFPLLKSLWIMSCDVENMAKCGQGGKLLWMDIRWWPHWPIFRYLTHLNIQ